jgi:hypothetical protein
MVQIRNVLVEIPLQGLILYIPTQGCGRFASSALGFAVPRFQRWTDFLSLTSDCTRSAIALLSNAALMCYMANLEYVNGSCLCKKNDVPE